MGNPKQVDMGGSDVVVNNLRVGVGKAGGTTATAPAILAGSGAPASISAPTGSLYLNRTGATTTSRLYINISTPPAGTSWTNFTSAA